MNIAISSFFSGKGWVTVIHEHFIMICVKVLTAVFIFIIVLVSTVRGQLCNGPGNFCYNSTHFGICISQESGSFVPLDLVLQCPVGSDCVPQSYYPCSFNSSSVTSTTELVKVNYSDTFTVNNPKNISLNSSHELLNIYPAVALSDNESVIKSAGTTELNDVSILIVKEVEISIQESQPTNISSTNDSETQLNVSKFPTIMNETAISTTDTKLELSTSKNTQLYYTEVTDPAEQLTDKNHAYTTNETATKKAINVDDSLLKTTEDSYKNMVSSVTSLATVLDNGNFKDHNNYSTDSIHEAETIAQNEEYASTTGFFETEVISLSTDIPNSGSDITTDTLVSGYTLYEESDKDNYNATEETNSVTTRLNFTAGSKISTQAELNEFSTIRNYETTDQTIGNSTQNDRTKDIFDESSTLSGPTANEESETTQPIEASTNVYEELTKDKNSTNIDEKWADSTLVDSSAISDHTVTSKVPLTSILFDVSSDMYDTSTINKELEHSEKSATTVSEPTASKNSHSPGHIDVSTSHLSETSTDSASSKTDHISTNIYQSTKRLESSSPADSSTKSNIIVSPISTDSLPISDETKKLTEMPSTLEFTSEDTYFHITTDVSRPQLTTAQISTKYAEASNVPGNTADYETTSEYRGHVTFTDVQDLDSSTHTIKAVIVTTESVEESTDSNKPSNNISESSGGTEKTTASVTLVSTSSTNITKTTSSSDDVPTTLPNVSTSLTDGKVTSATFQCVRYGIFKDLEDCSKFHVCHPVGIYATKHLELKCRSNFGFSSIFHKCVPKHLSDCPLLTSTTVKSTTSAKTESTTSISTTPKMFRCKSFGAFSDPSDCTKFYVCYRFYSQIMQKEMQCKYGYAFSTFAKACVPQHISGCPLKQPAEEEYQEHEREENIKFMNKVLEKREKDLEERKRNAKREDQKNRKKEEKEFQEQIKKQEKEAEERRKKNEKQLQEKIKKQEREAEQIQKQEQNRKREELEKEEMKRRNEEKEKEEKRKMEEKIAEKRRKEEEKELERSLRESYKAGFEHIHSLKRIKALSEESEQSEESEESHNHFS